MLKTLKTLCLFFLLPLSGTAWSLSDSSPTPISTAIIPDPPLIAAKGYVLMDFQTGAVIAAGNENDRLAPARLTKILTSYVIGQEIKSGRITMEDAVSVSEKAWAKN